MLKDGGASVGEHTARLFHKVTALAQSLSALGSVSSSIAMVPVLIADHLGTADCACWLLDEGGARLVPIGRVPAAGNDAVPAPSGIPLAQHPALAALLSGARFLLPEDEEVAALCATLQVLPGMLAVLSVQAHVLGLLYLRFSTTEIADLIGRDLLQLVAVQAAMALERASATGQPLAVTHAARLTLVQQTARTLSATRSVSALCQALAETIYHALRCQVVGIYLREGDELRVMGVCLPEGAAAPVAARVISLGQGIIGHVAASGAPYLCKDTWRDPFFSHAADVLGSRSELTVPLRVGTEVAGVINLESQRLNAFTSADIATLSAIADQAGIALQNARLYQAEAELRRRAEVRARRLEQIQRLGERLKLEMDEREVGLRVVLAAREAVNFRMAVLNLFDRPGDPTSRARVVATAGLPPEGEEILRSHDFPLSAVTRLFQPEFRVSRSYFIPQESGLHQDTEVASWTPELHNAGAGAWRAGDELLVPLTDPHAGHLVGFLSVDDPESGCRPEREEVEALEIFADQAVVALRNARLLAQARRQAERDPVTGLLNHRVANSTLGTALAAAQERSEPLSLITLDVDNFKLINDTHGHLIGDSALRHVAHILQQCVRAQDAVARLGGDEFLVILPGAPVSAALDVVQRLLAMIQHTPLPIEGAGTVPLRLSVGIAACPEDAVQPHALLAIADARLYEAKRTGGHTVELGARGPSREEPDFDSFDMLSALVAAVDNKDRYTREHSDHVAAYACALADVLGLSLESQRTVRIAGLLHDVGKIGVPDRILRKPGPLDPQEWEAMKQHVLLSTTLLRTVGFDADVLAAVAHHHERWDGQGYPLGLRGMDVPLLGRIMILADAAAAMSANRPYRPSLPLDTVIAEIRAESGKQFDPSLVEPFITALRRTHIDMPHGSD